MFENILRFIRSKMHSKTVVIGTVAAATLALVVGGGPVAARVLGHGAFGASSLTSLVGPGSEGSQGSKAAGNASLAADPNRQAGTPGGGTTNRDPGRKTACPSGGVPAPGSTVNGGLVVDGSCTITNVTIHGGILIKASGHLTLYGSTVFGNTDVEPKGEFDSNFPERGQPNQLNGGVSATSASNMDIHGGTIRGRVLYEGTIPPTGFFTILSLCGVTLHGDLTVENVPPGVFAGRGFPNGAQLGDGEPDLTSPCLGNTISGSVVIRNNSGSKIELETNTIGGSVQIFNSDPSVTGNTIGGSLLCHQGAKLHVWDSDDSNTNTVHGTTHCA